MYQKSRLFYPNPSPQFKFGRSWSHFFWVKSGFPSFGCLFFSKDILHLLPVSTEWAKHPFKYEGKNEYSAFSSRQSRKVSAHWGLEFFLSLLEIDGLLLRGEERFFLGKKWLFVAWHLGSFALQGHFWRQEKTNKNSQLVYKGVRAQQEVQSRISDLIFHAEEQDCRILTSIKIRRTNKKKKDNKINFVCR